MESIVTVLPICPSCGHPSIHYIAVNGDTWQIQWIAPYEPSDIGLIRNTRAKRPEKDKLVCTVCKKVFSFEDFQKDEIHA